MADARQPDDHSGPKKSGRPLDLEKRNAVVRAARKLFLANGLDAVSVDAIASEAGVSKATVYRHFTDKEAVFDAVVAADVDQFRYPPTDVPFAGPAEFRDFVRQVGSMLVGFLSLPQDDDLGRLLMIEARRHPQHAARFIERGPDAMHSWLAEVLARGGQAGYLSAPDPAVASDQLLSMWLGMYHVRHQFGVASQRSAEDIDAHVSRCVDVLLRAYPPASPN